MSQRPNRSISIYVVEEALPSGIKITNWYLDPTLAELEARRAAEKRRRSRVVLVMNVPSRAHSHSRKNWGEEITETVRELARLDFPINHCKTLSYH